MSYVESGKGRSSVIDTGSLIARDGFSASEYQHTNRLVTVHFNEAIDLVLPFAEKVTLKAAHLTVDGSLDIPPSSGSAAWGDWNQATDLPRLNPSGLLLLGAAGVNGAATSDAQTEIRGETFNRYSGGHLKASGPAMNVGPAVGISLLGVAGVSPLALPRVRGFLGALFTRVTHSKALEHKRRKLLLEVIAQNEGLTVQFLACMANLSRRVTEYHVEVLARQGLIANLRIGSGTAVFTKDAVPSPEQLEAMRNVPNPTARKLLELLDANPQQSQREMAARLGVSQPCVHLLLKALAESGQVQVVASGPRRRYQVFHGLPG